MRDFRHGTRPCDSFSRTNVKTWMSSPLLQPSRSVAHLFKWQFALHFLQKMSSMAVRPNCVTYGAVLSACEKASTTYSSHWTFALQLVVDASTQNLSSDIMFSTSISACEKSSQWQKAVLELETLKKNKRKLQAYSFNPVMAGCVSSSHWKNAWGTI